MKPPLSTSTYFLHILLLPTFSLLLSLSLPAAVPIRWTVESSRVQPAQFESFKGESITLEASLTSYGKPLEIEGEPALYWQTNGMGAAWWTAPAAVASNVLSATWTPAMDVGAAAYTCFIGVTGSIYRAAFQLRIRHAPGEIPNELPLPVPTLDFDRVRVLHPPWPSIETVPPIISNVVTKSYVEALGITGGLDTNAVIEIANDAITTNAVVASHSSQLSQLSQKLPAVAQAATNYTDAATSATLATANRYAEESDSITYSEAVRDASYYTDRVAIETIGHAYTNSQMVANNARNQAVVLANNYTDSATNATLAAANAYTDAHAGTGGLSTNAVLALIEDSVGGTNAVRAAVAHTAVGPTWMRPNAWRLTSTPTRDVAEIAAVYYTTNNFRSYSNEVARVITTRSAQLRGERLDRYAVDPLIVTNFAAVTPGCSVDELGYVTAEADGQYRVAGTDSTGETRYCDIWFSAGIRDTVLNTIYVGDLAPHLAAANDAAKAVLENAALVSTYTVAGKTCNQYSTIAPAFAKSGAHGYYNPWAVSPHVLMTAGHMGYLGNRGPISYGGHTVNRVRAVWLKDWALTNGFTEAEVNAVSMIGDIEMIVCDNSGALPAEILPTFISPAAFAARFPGGIRGALLWSANQHHADMVPRVAMNDHGYYLYGDADFAAYPARADLAGRLAAMGQQHIFHGGDSGHVVFLRDDEYDIPITQYYSASTGPDLIAAFPMIKAFVESLGDTLKEVE